MSTSLNLQSVRVAARCPVTSHFDYRVTLPSVSVYDLMGITLARFEHEHHLPGAVGIHRQPIVTRCFLRVKLARYPISEKNCLTRPVEGEELPVEGLEMHARPEVTCEVRRHGYSMIIDSINFTENMSK